MPSTKVEKFFVQGMLSLETNLPREIKYRNLKRLTLLAKEKYVSLQIEVPEMGLRNDGRPVFCSGWYLSTNPLVSKGNKYPLFDGKQCIGFIIVEQCI